MLQQRAVLEQLNHSSLLLRKEKTLLPVCCFPVPFFCSFNASFTPVVAFVSLWRVS